MREFHIHHHLPTGGAGWKHQVRLRVSPSKNQVASLVHCASLAKMPVFAQSCKEELEPFGTLSPLSCAIRWAVVYAGAARR